MNFELVWKIMWLKFKPWLVESSSRLGSRFYGNDKIETFLASNASTFAQDPRGTMLTVFCVGICFGYMLREENNQEVTDLFKIELNPTVKENLQ